MANRRKSVRPRVRFSLRWKITIPFIFLALILGLGGIYLVNRLLIEDDQIRFLRQLADSGQQAADAVVRAEMDLLAVERLLANMEGIPQLVSLADAEGLRQRVLPVVVNAGVDMVAVLDPQGTSLLAIRARHGAPAGEYDSLRGEAFYTSWPFVQNVLQGAGAEDSRDKFAGLHSIRLGSQEVFVFMVAGPLLEAETKVVGAIVVGNYLDRFATAIGEQAGANLSIYDPSTGRLIASTLEPGDPSSLTIPSDLLSSSTAPGEEGSPARILNVAGAPYQEVLTPLVAREATQQLGVMGISLLQSTFLASTTQRVVGAIQFTAAAIVLVLVIGLMVSNSITRPLVEIAAASTEIAAGNLNTRVVERGSDEISLLARTFNRMVVGLKEGSLYRDLLGRTVAPEVRDQLKKTMADGSGMNRGETARSTILFADLRGFTAMAEEAPPAEVMSTLNECFSGIVPVASRHGGVISKFDGDAIMAFFGILPRPLPPQVSALQACHAAMEMMAFVKDLNRKRRLHDKPELAMGIGIATGSVIAGGLGTPDRLNYTVIGDAVNTAQRIQQITSEAGTPSVLISEETYRSLGSAQTQFVFGRRGTAQLKGKAKQVTVFELRDRKARLVEEQATKPG